MLRVRAALTCVFVLVVVGGCIRHVKLVNPPTQSFAPRPVDRVEAVLVDCLNRRGWIPTREGPGVIHAVLHVGSHTAMIAIEYTADSYTLRYLSSENLIGAGGIHVNYNAWVADLMKDISTQLAANPVR